MKTYTLCLYLMGGAGAGAPACLGFCDIGVYDIGVCPQCGQPSVNLRKSIHKSEKHVRKILGGTRLGP